MPKKSLKSSRGFITLQIHDFDECIILIIGEHIYRMKGTIEEAQNAIMVQYNNIIEKELSHAEDNNKHEDNQ